MNHDNKRRKISPEEVARWVKNLGNLLPVRASLLPVARGGDHVALMLCRLRADLRIVSLAGAPGDTIVVDDILDTGATRGRYHGKHTWAVMVRRSTCDRWLSNTFEGHVETTNDWLVFPWEVEDLL